MGLPKGGIAFFDSGIGGLTVMAECRKRLPSALFYYYGDNRHAPYGNLPPRKIRKYALKAFRVFRRLQACAVVIACNTVTAVCIDMLREKYTFPIIGTEPALRFAAKNTKGEVYALMTKATSESERVKKLLLSCQKAYPEAEIRIFPCERLAGEIELHAQNVDYDYRAFLPNGAPSAVVLGCTHYVYIKEYIQKYYRCNVYDGNKGIAERLYARWSGSAIQKGRTVPFEEEKSSKYRDERPLKEKLTRLRYFLRLKIRILRDSKKKQVTNKCLKNYKNKHSANTEKQRSCGIIFLGKNRRCNEEIYKQMFEN